VPTSSASHIWTFVRRGGLNQVALESAADLEALDQLDPKLWVALACPVKGLELDERTLALVDTDNDGRIRLPEVVAAAKWAASQLKDPHQLFGRETVLPLTAIDEKTDSGRAILAAARKILGDVGKPEADSISLDDLAEPEKLFPAGKINGDGVIPPATAPDEATRKLIEDIAGAYGSHKGKTGSVGITPDEVNDFFHDLEGYAKWADASAPKEISFLGSKPDAAYAAIAAIRGKADDYFVRCGVTEFDERSIPVINRTEDDYAALAAKPALQSSPELAAFPLAQAAPSRALPLRSGINPAWAAAVEALRTDAVAPAFGPDKDFLTHAEWQDLTGRFGAYEGWLKDKPTSKAASLTVSRAKEILAGHGREELDALIAKDAELAPAYEAATDLERLIRFRRGDLLTLLRNFVNFADLYSPDRMAIFEAGFLFLDSRACELCIKVDDPGAHAVLATMSKACIGYVECKRPGGATLKLAALFTQGDIDYLYVGRNGIFIDRKGHDWDATIVKLIDNPISIRQAFWAPYKKFVRFIEAQVAKQAAAADTKSETVLTGVASGPAAAAQAPAAGKKFDVGTIAALGVAVGGISGAIGGILGAFFGLKAWMPLGLLGIMLAISGPSMLIAWLKLRQRNLGPVLEASGWAINGRVKITVPLGRLLTEVAHLPPGSIRRLKDPFRNRRRGLWWLLVFAVLVAIAAAILVARRHHS
jgi:hypothetical protein